MSRHFIALAALAALAGCGGSDPSVPRTETVYRTERPSAVNYPFGETLRPDCKTVNLFSPAVFKTPGPGAPRAASQFIGHWGDAAWEGAWCHDLYVTEVLQDGRVVVIETHGAYAPWGKRPSIFRRTGRLDQNDRLQIRYGPYTVEYWLQGGKLHGTRKHPGGTRWIAMSRQG